MNRSTQGSGQVFPKCRIPVRIRFSDQTVVIGAVFIRQGQRVLDMICDERMSFPVLATAGITLVNKTPVRQIDVLGLPEIADIRDALPELDMTCIERSAGP